MRPEYVRIDGVYRVNYKCTVNPRPYTQGSIVEVIAVTYGPNHSTTGAYVGLLLGDTVKESVPHSFGFVVADDLEELEQ